MRSLLVASVALAFIASAFAQESGADRNVERALLDPSLTTPTRASAPELSFNINEDQKTVKLQFGTKIDFEKSWALTLSGPLDEDNDTTSLATLDGLDDSVNAELAFNRTVHSSSGRKGPPMSARQLSALCLQDTGKRNCTLADLSPTVQQVVEGTFGPVFRYGGAVKVGHKSYEYFDTAAESQTVTRNGWSASASAGFFPPGKIPITLLYYASVSVKRESAYKKADDAELCTPVTGSNIVQCKTLPFGPPGNTRSTIAQLDLRQFPHDLVALAPRARYTDSTDKKKQGWSFALPIYIRQKNDGPFNGGISLNWDTQNRTFGVSLFVGALGSL
jgi:hypothetical protein